MAETSATLAQQIVIDLAPIVDIEAATEITQPSPVDVNVASINNVVSISAVSAPAPVGYTKVSTSDEVTNESLNRTAETLKNDINSKLTSFAANVSDALADANSDISSQVIAINNAMNDLKGDINIAFNEIRLKEISQTAEISAAVNERLAKISLNEAALKTAIQRADEKVRALDDVYGTDADIASKVTGINNLISTLRESDIDVVAALDGTIDEVNSLTRIKRKKFTINSGSGERSIDTVLDGFGEFLAPGDYIVDAEAFGNRKVFVEVSEQTANGFKLALFSQGVHFLPQPWASDLNPVEVVVTVTHAKRDPLTFNIDTLNSSFVTNGSGTDASTVGA